MGLHFGELYKIRRVVYFRLSPYEQKPFKGFISEGLPNIFRRIHGRIYRIVPIYLTGYLIYKWALEENERCSRKNPADFANDV